MSTIRKVEERMRPTNRGSTMRKDSDEDYGGSDGDAASPAIGLERANIKRSSGDTPGVWDVERDKFPYAIVWTPIPCITWFLPFVGHMGIADSYGAIHDFAGPYYIGYDDMAFGRPSRYLILDPKQITAPSAPSGSQSWDASIAIGDSVYKKRMHNLICDNCHSHVACCLNDMKYGGSSSWNMVKLAAWMFFAGRFVSVGRTISSFLPFAIVLTLIVVLTTEL